MFIGEYTYSVDEKRRLSIPSNFRTSLGTSAVVTRGIDSCLTVYPTKEWKELSKKLQNLPTAKGEARGFVRILLSGAVQVKFDKLGRILLPDFLKKYAQIRKNVVIIGLGNKIEIWDKKVWEIYKTKTEAQVGSIAEKLEELGI